MERRSKLGEIGGGDEAQETVDSEKQTEGFGGEGCRGWVSLFVGIMEGMYCMEHWMWYINNEFWNTEKNKILKNNASLKAMVWLFILKFLPYPLKLFITLIRLS